MKSVRIRSYSGPYLPAFRLNTERYSVSLRIQSKCGKIWTKITPNTDTFHTVHIAQTCETEYAKFLPFANNNQRKGKSRRF